MDRTEFGKDLTVLTRKEICKKYNFSSSAINYWKKKFQIPKDRPNLIQNMSSAEFRSLIYSSCNFAEARDKIGLKGSSACSRIKKRCESEDIDYSHINLEKPSENRRSRNRDLPHLSQKQLEIILGSMLGDGCLTKIYGKRGQSCFVEGHCTKQKDYLFWKYQELKTYFKRKPFKVQRAKIHCCDGKIVRDTKKKVPFWMAMSVQHPVFTSLEKNWYLRDEKGNYVYKSNGHRIKIIPKNFKLTPQIIAVWYCDDGSVSVNNKMIQLATNSFSKEEVNFLINLLDIQFGIKSKLLINQRGEPTIRIYADSFLDFFKIIEAFQLPYLEYKFDLKNYNPHTCRQPVHSDEIIANIFSLAKSGIKQNIIATKLGLSKSFICNVLKGKR